MERVAFIGLGNMGAPMAANLCKAGWPLTVYNRHAEKTAPLAAMGATVAQSVGGAVRGADVIVTMVSDDAAVRELVLDAEGVLAQAATGQLLIDMSTVSPALSREVAAAAQARGVDVLDAPVSGSVKPATEGTLVILVGGEPACYARALPLLQAMGKEIFHLGPHGAGTHMKLCINMLLGATVQTIAESIVLAEKGGLTREQMLNVINVSACQSPIAKLKTPAFLAGDYPPAFALKHMAKDFGLAMQRAQELNVALPITAAGNESFITAKNIGLADLDIAAILKLLEQLNGLG